ncbi:MAG: radical SAM protein [Candidatus Portnoybacteria bacterium]|nr:radical SAM protein [Candidatus Portnoybacteria bacterium]MDD4982462.1 radical SAM protein [Candidatus Portnoybacteria bacterium]
MKILLISPPDSNEILSCNPELVKKERGCDPPLGLLYLAGYLEKQPGLEIKVLDTQVEKLDYRQIEERVREFMPDVVGMTIMTFTIFDVLEVVKIVKKISPTIKVALGGPHAHIYPKETLDLPGVDFAILGEGEAALAGLLANINQPEKLKMVKNLAFKHNGQFINTGVQDFIKDLDSLPFPARHLVPYKKYTNLLAKKTPHTTMFTSRGCPYQCTFCDRPTMGRFFRARSAKNIVDEMAQCVKMGIEEIFIYDDTFTVDRQRVIAICDEIQRRGLKFTWDIRARVNTVDEEVLTKLKAAGCERIHYGVEAGTEKILKVLNKGIHLDQALAVFRLTQKIGISTFAYFMIGAPEETKADVLASIEFAKKLNPAFVQVTTLTPFPATKIYLDALATGQISNDYWLEFARHPKRDFQTPHWTKILSEEELRELSTRFYKEFYVRPGYIFKQLLQIRSLGELIKKSKAGLKIIFS